MGPFASGLVGSPWTPGSVTGWPGVNGIIGDRNYLSQNMYLQDPQTVNVVNERSNDTIPMKGGRSGKRKRKIKKSMRKKGGGFVDTLMYPVQNSIATFRGVNSVQNPAPYMDQLRSLR